MEVFHFATRVSECNAPGARAAPAEIRAFMAVTPHLLGRSASDRSLPYPRHARHRPDPAFARRVHRDAWAPPDRAAGRATLHGRTFDIRSGTEALVSAGFLSPMPDGRYGRADLVASASRKPLVRERARIMPSPWRRILCVVDLDNDTSSTRSAPLQVRPCGTPRRWPSRTEHESQHFR